MAGELERRPPNRAQLQRALIANAATKPVNVVVPAGVAVVAAAMGAGWLFAVAVVVYLALVAATFFDEDEAARVGKARYAALRPGRPEPKKFAPPIAQALEQALAEEHQIRQTIAGSNLGFEEVSGEVDGLVASLGQSAERAQLVYDYLASQDLSALDARLNQYRRSQEPEHQRAAAAMEEQLRLGRELETVLDRFLTQLEHAVVSLQTIRGQLVRISVAGESDRQAEAAERVRSVRDDLTAVADGLDEAYARADAA